MPREPAVEPVTAIQAAVARALHDHVPVAATIVVALSGGRDSVVLLDALSVVAPTHARRVVAAHVHHGLSAHADAWVDFCKAQSAARDVQCVVRRVDVVARAQQSLEGEARRLRYAALADMAHEAGANVVLLAHHRDDQAETLLLQLLRGAGPHGLAAMPSLRTHPRGIHLLRPLLDISRAQINVYAVQRELRWIDDDSNASAVHRRNALRQRVMPALASLEPEFSTTLARAAGHQADAAQLSDELAALDAACVGDGTTLERAAFATLAPHRARNLLRWFLRQHALPAPSAARLTAMLTQLTAARTDARVRLQHAGAEIGIHRGRIVVHGPPSLPFDMQWNGEDALTLPHGILTFGHVEGSGIDATLLAQAMVRVRPRDGGERLQVSRDRPRRALKSLLQEFAIPAWARGGWPLVYCGKTLAAVPGLGVSAPFQTAPGCAGINVEWMPRPLR